MAPLQCLEEQYALSFSLLKLRCVPITYCCVRTIASNSISISKHRIFEGYASSITDESLICLVWWVEVDVAID